METDICCAVHDSCKRTVPARSRKFGYTNKLAYDIHSCDCDDKFKDCLKRSRDGFGDVVGKMYFNQLKIPCLRFAKEEAPKPSLPTVLPDVDKNKEIADNEEQGENKLPIAGINLNVNGQRVASFDNNEGGAGNYGSEATQSQQGSQSQISQGNSGSIGANGFGTEFRNQAGNNDEPARSGDSNRNDFNNEVNNFEAKNSGNRANNFDSTNADKVNQLPIAGGAYNPQSKSTESAGVPTRERFQDSNERVLNSGFTYGRQDVQGAGFAANSNYQNRQYDSYQTANDRFQTSGYSRKHIYGY